MGNNYQILAIGDITLDVFIIPTESEMVCSIDKKECLICFKYGDKIPVRSMEFSVGGNAANNSVGVARMGLRAGVVTTLGGGNVGDQIIEKLQKEGVDVTYAIRQAKAGSNYSTILNYAGERTIFSYHAPRSYEFPVQLPPAPWIYLTSMGETFRPFYNHFVDWLKEHPNVKLAFNPGSRQLRAGLDAIRDVLSMTHIIYVNRDEAEIITGAEGAPIKELLQKLSELGPKITIITQGSRGSYLYDGSKFLRAGILPVDAYERTGAGDAFGAGFMSAIIKGKNFEDAMMWGTVNSASVIGYVGSQKGLLRESDIPQWLERAKSSNLKVEEF